MIKWFWIFSGIFILVLLFASARAVRKNKSIDDFMFFMIFWFGYKLRKKAQIVGFKGMAGMMSRIYDTPKAGYVVFLAAFIFLIPYVAIQIRGISMFFVAIFPNALPPYAWSIIIIAIMIIYSEIGGLKAIVFSDAIQGILLLTVEGYISGA